MRFPALRDSIYPEPTVIWFTVLIKQNIKVSKSQGKMSGSV
jgi:hypothetical protein